MYLEDPRNNEDDPLENTRRIVHDLLLKLLYYAFVQDFMGELTLYINRYVPTIFLVDADCETMCKVHKGVVSTGGAYSKGQLKGQALKVRH